MLNKCREDLRPHHASCASVHMCYKETEIKFWESQTSISLQLSWKRVGWVEEKCKFSVQAKK